MYKHLFFLGITVALSFQSFAQAGKLDLSFGTDGKVTTSLSALNDHIKDVLVQPDGKIIAVGFSSLDKHLQISLARYHSNGSLDSSFGTYGKQFTSFDTSYLTAAFSAALQSDGKIVVAGQHEAYSGAELPTTIVALARYNNDGSLDHTFGSAGKVTKLFGTIPAQFYSGANSVAIQTDGKIVIGGFKQAPGMKEFLLIRYLSNGLIDSSFGTDGVVTTNFGDADAQVYKVLIQKDGKILAVGNSFNAVALARYNVDGTLDPSFDMDGKQTTAEGLDFSVAESAVLQKDGKIVVAGHRTDIHGFYTQILALRYLSNGALDNSFSADGIQTFNLSYTHQRANSVLLQSDDKILISGYGTTGSFADFVLLRLNTDGNYDYGFNGSGKAITNFGTAECNANAMALQKDNKIIVAGINKHTTNTQYALARYFSGIELGLANFDENNHQISVYPNPVLDHVMLQYTLKNAATISVELRDVQGKLISVLQERKPQPAGDYSASLALPSNLTTGNYLICLSSANGAIYTKITKQF